MGTRQREFCCLFSLKKITVLSRLLTKQKLLRNWTVIPSHTSLFSSPSLYSSSSFPRPCSELFLLPRLAGHPSAGPELCSASLVC